MSKTCSRCGSQIPEGHTICPTCGAPLPKSAPYIRCSHCHHRVPAHLAVCPHCGRELKPWRADKIVVGISLLILLGLWFFFGNGFSVVSNNSRSLLMALLPPRITPVVQKDAHAATATPLTISATVTPIIPTATSPLADTPTTVPTDTPTTTPQPPATATPTVTATLAATVVATKENAPPQPTTSPTATTTPTIKPSPTATATSSPTATATPQPQPDVYIVEAGDTLSGIADKVGRTIAALAAYNNIQDPTSIYVGQKLKIPPADYIPPTPTPRLPTKTPTPTPTATPSITLPAPLLLSPGNTTPFQGQNTLIELVWQALPTGIPAGAEYVVHIGVKVGENQVDWRLTEAVGTNTRYQVPAWLFGQAPQQFGRTYIWYVQVGYVTREGDKIQVVPISQPSEQRVFYWN